MTDWSVDIVKKLLCSTALFAGMALSGVCLAATGGEVEPTEVPVAVTVNAENTISESESETETCATGDGDQIMELTDDEIFLLAKIAMAEAESESTEGKALVILVVLNRVQSDEFPDTIEDVLNQRTGGGGWQFSPMQDGGRWYTTEPDEDSYEAVELVMAGWDESRGALYFESSEDPTWHSMNLEYLYTVGSHKFYR